ncbi:type IV pilus secretin PilQ [Trinickia terrae]|uniref:Type IV pilus secretin PilQ n=1 Tax=Trinickia terrae TaxID=2571161 RepID=A0A4U1IB76_9BURK|nr:type IV pilus secretin PilQ [Trinickia terrae]TKC90789.1 type IV pilus secretin PilQ [Trinickia terrae]
MTMRCRARLIFVVACFAAAARASEPSPLPPLPPLPEHMPFDDSVGRHAGLPWLPHGRSVPTPNPFHDQGSAQGGFTPLDDADTSEDGAAASSKPPTNGPAESPAVSGPDAPLEGPPVPLAPMQRMSRTPADPHESGADDNKPITLNFQNADLGAVLDAFARFTNLNIVASERVRGFVSLRLNNVPWRTAFDTLLDVNGLAMERRGNVIWVAPLADLAARERQRFEAHARAADLEPLASRTFELHYARADDVVRLLGAQGSQRVLSKRGAAMADPRTNLLFVTDLEARLEQIAGLLASIDKPTRQVLIEAQIVEGEQGFSRDLGARLSLRATKEGAPSPGLAGGGSEGTVYDLSARPISGYEAATAGLTLFAARATRLLNVELSALEAEGRGQIVSSPRVVTADRMKAIVEQGTEVPYQAKVGNGVSGVQFRRASLKLEVEPRITPKGRVVLELDVAKDSVGEQTANGPAINTKHVQTRVEVEDGGTVSIGGIYESNDRDDVTRVPLLGKIPLLGALFRHRAQSERRSELVVFITPRVVETP